MKIAISGKMCSGKTTLAKLLQDNYDYTVISFASPMKRLVKDMQLPLCERVAQIYGDCVHLWGEELGYGVAGWIIHTFLEPGVKFEFHGKDDRGRKILQQLGHEARELFGENIWLLPMKRTIEDTAGKIVIDDVRYPNELEFCEDNGFVTIRLEVPIKERLRRIKKLYGEVKEDKLKHPTEKLLDSRLPEAMFDVAHWWEGEKPIDVVGEIQQAIKELQRREVYIFP